MTHHNPSQEYADKKQPSLAGHVLIRMLEAHGLNHVFSVPGESFLAALDGLHDSQIDVITCRHEGAATMMAEAQGKITGKPGIAFVTRGPGACNASSGIHVAKQDSTPMITFIGQVARDQKDREAFQEVDFQAFYTPLAKWAAQIDDPERLPEYIARAFQVACNGRPGPVVLALPEDMLRTPISYRAFPPSPAPQIGISHDDLISVKQKILSSAKPLLIVGGSCWSGKAQKALQVLSEQWGLPVSTAFRRQDYFDNQHPSYAGDIGIGANPELIKMLAEADTVILLGTRLGEIASGGYQHLNIPKPKQYLIHIHRDSDELGRVYQPDLAVVTDPAAFVLAATTLSGSESVSAERRAWITSFNQAYQSWHQPSGTIAEQLQTKIMKVLRQKLPQDAIICNGAGNYAVWLHRFFTFTQYGTQLAPTSGSMGYGLPAAIAAKLNNPEQTVFALAGDGCWQMTMQELSTAVQHQLNIVVLIFDNAMLGTIRLHQAKQYPDRISATLLQNPDFAAIATASGAAGFRATDYPSALHAIDQALQEKDRPSVIHIQVDPNQVSPTLALADLETTQINKTGNP